MAELVPVPLPLLLRRAFLEYRQEGKIFDLPKARFFRGLPGLDMSVISNGHRASTPLGPAAGPHDQLAQNIVLCWLGGARIIELKTVQILDELEIPRPCIDAASVGYNIEWSQELKLEQSLREYVSAAMFLEILKTSKVLGEDFPGEWGDTIFDMSAGYNLEGIRSPRMRQWIQSMKTAGPIVDELRAGLTGPWAAYRDLPFPGTISDTITLSTFHGCPAREIEGIVSFLLAEMDVHVCVKLNPTMLGRAEVERLLHDVLGYREIQCGREAFDRDLRLDEALDLIPRLDRTARAHGKRLSVKFSNTLVVKNHKTYLSGDVMYMSGAPLHVVTMNLVRKFREHMGASVPISFSAGLDANNIASAVAMNFIPVTTCTDLLRPGGYARLIRYLENLGEKMRLLGVTRIPDFVVRYRGQAAAAVERVVRAMRDSLSPDVGPALRCWLDTPGRTLDSVCRELNAPALEQALVDAAGLLNTPLLVEEATANPRYSWERNKGVPRKIGASLWFYDCITCDKCVPVCPNDANFVYETTPAVLAYDNFELSSNSRTTDSPAAAKSAEFLHPLAPRPPACALSSNSHRRVPGGVVRIVKTRQFANYADACNECGNCDILCPEDGGPYVAKPRFFGSFETYRKYGSPNGFYIDFATGPKTIYGTIAGKAYALTVDPTADRAWFDAGNARVEIRLGTGDLLTWEPKPGAGSEPLQLDMLPYLQLKLLVESVSDPRHVNFANVAGLQENDFGNQASPAQG